MSKSQFKNIGINLDSYQCDINKSNFKKGILSFNIDSVTKNTKNQKIGVTSRLSNIKYIVLNEFNLPTPQGYKNLYQLGIKNTFTQIPNDIYYNKFTSTNKTYASDLINTNNLSYFKHKKIYIGIQEFKTQSYKANNGLFYHFACDVDESLFIPCSDQSGYCTINTNSDSSILKLIPIISSFMFTPPIENCETLTLLFHNGENILNLSESIVLVKPEIDIIYRTELDINNNVDISTNRTTNYLETTKILYPDNGTISLANNNESISFSIYNNRISPLFYIHLNLELPNFINNYKILKNDKIYISNFNSFSNKTSKTLKDFRVTTVYSIQSYTNVSTIDVVQNPLLEIGQTLRPSVGILPNTIIANLITIVGHYSRIVTNQPVTLTNNQKIDIIETKTFNTGSRNLDYYINNKEGIYAYPVIMDISTSITGAVIQTNDLPDNPNNFITPLLEGNKIQLLSNNISDLDKLEIGQIFDSSENNMMIDISGTDIQRNIIFNQQSVYKNIIPSNTEIIKLYNIDTSGNNFTRTVVLNNYIYLQSNSSVTIYDKKKIKLSPFINLASKTFSNVEFHYYIRKFNSLYQFYLTPEYYQPTVDLWVNSELKRYMGLIKNSLYAESCMLKIINNKSIIPLEISCEI